jgi:predicted PurR-regulated permease PerM
MKRGFAITLVYLGILLIPAGLAAVLLPPLINSGVDLVQDLPGYAQDFQDTLHKNESFRKLDENFDINNKLQDAANSAVGSVDNAAGTLGNIGTAVINSLFAGFTILILSMFMVARGRGWVDGVVERADGAERDALRRTFDKIGKAVGAFIGGAIIQAFIAGLASFIVLAALGIPNPLALAAVVGVLDVIPLVGSTIAGILVGVVTLFADVPIDPIVWVAFVIAYQQFENYVVQPQIQRRAVKLEPFIVLIAVIAGGALMGVVGAILAIPIAATIQIIVQEYRRLRVEIASSGPETSTA